MKHKLILVLLQCCVFAVNASPAAAQSSFARCRVEIAEGNLALAMVHDRGLSSCLRFLNYSDCKTSAWRIEAAQADLDRVLQTSACADARYVDGHTDEELFFGAIVPTWAYPRSTYYATIQTAANSYAERQWGLNNKMRDDLDLPTEVPESKYERKCIRAAQSAMVKAVSTGVTEQIGCAEDGGEPPWDCPIDTSAESRLGASLEQMHRKISKCRDAAGVTGAVSGAVRDMCNRSVTTTADFEACIRQSTLCQVCVISNLTLGMDQDCAAISGDRNCDPSITYNFGKPAAGSFFVANEGEGSVTAFAADGSYAFGDLAASTFPTGPTPVDVVVAERTNVIAVVNRDGNSVTLLNARDGTYATGSQAQSSKPVGGQPSAAAVNPESDFLYVANAADDTVTFLDAWDGSYVFGSLAASTFVVGDSPSALAVDSTGSTLYVVNAGDGTVTFLDAKTGAPKLGNLALSSFPVGNHPSAIAWFATDTDNRIAVSNRDDDTVALLDADSGAPADGTLAESLRSVATGPIAVAAFTHEGSTTLLTASAEASAISASREPDPWLTNDGTVAAVDVPTGFAPGDIALASSVPYHKGAPYQLLATSPSADAVYRVPLMTPYELAGPGDAERSMFPLPPNPLHIAANEAESGFYVIYFGNAAAIDPLLFIDASGQVQWEVEIPNVFISGMAYSAASNTVFIGTPSGVLYLDGSDGSYKFGTLEASTFVCGCNGQPRFADEDTGILYASCSNGVAYLDAYDGSCPTLATPAIDLGTQVMNDISLDEATGILYVAVRYSTGIEYRNEVMRYDAVTGAWFTGDYDGSVVWTEAGANYQNLRIEAPDGGDVVYGLFTGTSTVSVRSAATGALLATRTLSGDLVGFGSPAWLQADVASNRLLVYRRYTRTAVSVVASYGPSGPFFDDFLVLDGDTLEFAGADLAGSRLILGETEGNGGFSRPFALNHAMDRLGVLAYDNVESYYDTPCNDVGPGLILLEPSGDGFAMSLSADEAGFLAATGDRPGAIGVMPVHTQILYSYNY